MARCSGIKLVLTGFLLALALLSTSAGARGPTPVDASMTVSVAELPRQGAETYRLILQGGPFPYEKDGTVFTTRSRISAVEIGAERSYSGLFVEDMALRSQTRVQIR